jgi:L-serine dehydratase
VIASVFDLFRVGIGPSSSHTVGPMRAARDLVARLGDLGAVTSLRAELFGSLGATGRGHGSDRAVIAGLMGAEPETVEPDWIDAAVAQVQASGQLTLTPADPAGAATIAFDPARDLCFRPAERLAYHPNALRFTVSRPGGDDDFVYYSIGGGFIVADDGTGRPAEEPREVVSLPHPFRTGAELLGQCQATGLGVAELMYRNELARGLGRDAVRSRLLGLWAVMSDCIHLGCHTEGVLPGGLGVRRRAPRLLRQLKHQPEGTRLSDFDWVSLWALATNEQNAAGGRVVTAPTNGAAGIVPAVLTYAMRFLPGSDDDTAVDFLLAAGAIGAVYQATASISGAEVGCQGEIGVACSMAAAGLAQVLGGSAEQVANAAEIGLEHHLGLTCDPVGGLVQVPCIERNAVGATTAITAARLALAGDGRQIVSLDQVIATMMATGRDMQTKYKETAEGGLALSVVAC